MVQRLHRVLCLQGFVLMVLAMTMAQPAAAGEPLSVLRGQGAWEADVWTAETSTILRLADEDASDYRLEAEIMFAPRGRGEIRVCPADATDSDSLAAIRVQFTRDDAGHLLRAIPMPLDDEANTWDRPSRDDQVMLDFGGRTSGVRRFMEADGIEPATWHDRWVSLRVKVTGNHVSLWMEGMLIHDVTRDDPQRGPVVLELAAGDRLRDVSITPTTYDWRYVTIDLSRKTNLDAAAMFDDDHVTVGEVPFELVEHGARQLDLREAQWVDWHRDPPTFYEDYDHGPHFLHDPRMPMLRLPKGDYVAVHLLATAVDEPELISDFTLRAGRYGHSNARRTTHSHTVQFDFPGSAPHAEQPVHVTVPMRYALAQDLEQFMEVELTRQVRLAVRSPDPNRFRYRPLGPASGVRIAAITFERSPLQMTVTSDQPAHAFNEPDEPTFHVRLHNISDRPQSFELRGIATHLDEVTVTRAEALGSVGPGEVVETPLAIPTEKRGYHELNLTLADATGDTLLTRKTSFARLPVNTREHRDTSPFGTWDFGGGHYGIQDPDVIGSLLTQLGLRYGMFTATAEERARHGIVRGTDFKIRMQDPEEVLERYDRDLERNPDSLPQMMIFHEDVISGPHVMRVPDMFHDRPPYRFDEREQERFDRMWHIATRAATLMREHHPEVKIMVGNGPLPTKEALYAAGLPAELFDAAGNEPAGFGRPPESQPPDFVAYNASIWMDRQLLDHYGYPDHAVWQCYEIGYPSTNPGNLTPRDQADYYVRHSLHSLAWHMPQIRIGLLHDVGNSYRFSNWGASGFARMAPEINVKPAFVAMATMTLVLDGATFTRKLDMGTISLYGLSFDRPDGAQVHAMWSMRGSYPVTLQLDDATPLRVMDDQADEHTLTPDDAHRVTLSLSPSPLYVVSEQNLVAVDPGEPIYDDAPRGDVTRLSRLSSLDGWRVVRERDMDLEFYNFMTPRRLGDFEIEPVSHFEGRDNVLRVAPRPIGHGKATVPMYQVLEHQSGLSVPGEPTEVGVWVNGNGGWGRVIFEFVDASGQRWTSIGATMDEDVSPWMNDWLPREVLEAWETPTIADWNTDDVFGYSRINFDGWRYVHMPMPGQYPGEGYHWPRNSQWRYDGDGTVHYPLTFKRLVVELPEKVLHVTDFIEPPRPEIYLSDLIVGEDEHPGVKTTITEW